MKCGNCGKPLPAGATRCSGCRAAVGQADPSAELAGMRAEFEAMLADMRGVMASSVSTTRSMEQLLATLQPLVDNAATASRVASGERADDEIVVEDDDDEDQEEIGDDSGDEPSDDDTADDDEEDAGDGAVLDLERLAAIEAEFWRDRAPAAGPGGKRASIARLSERMDAVDLDSDSTLEDLLAVTESAWMGVEMWTSGKRSGNAKYRCRLFRFANGERLREVVHAEGPTAWVALAAAVVTAFEEGELQWG